MLPGGAAARSSASIASNAYLYYTFFDKPPYFNMLLGDSATENEFFELEIINFKQKESER